MILVVSSAFASRRSAAAIMPETLPPECASM
jgi:hypothetical protein